MTTETNKNAIEKSTSEEMRVAFSQVPPQVAQHVSNISQGLDSADGSHLRAVAENNKIMARILSKLTLIDSISGVITQNQHDKLKEDLQAIERDSNLDSLGANQINNLQTLLLQKIQSQSLIKNIIEIDDEEKKKLQQQIESRHHQINEGLEQVNDKNANMHLYRVVTMFALGGVLDFLDIFGAVLDNFDGSFADGVKGVLGDEKAMSFFADINKAFGIDQIFGEISKIPILNDVNQLVVDLAGSEYLNPFTSLAGSVLDSHGAKLVFGAGLMLNRFVNEYEIYSDFSDAHKQAKEAGSEFEMVISQKIDEFQQKTANIIVKDQAKQASDATIFKAYIKQLINDDTKQIPEDFTRINFNQNDGPLANNLTSWIEQERAKNKENPEGDKARPNEESITDLLLKINGSKENSQEQYNKILDKAKKWQADPAISKDDKEALLQEKTTLLQKLGLPQEEIDKNTKDKDLGKIDDYIQETFIAVNQQKVLEKIKYENAPKREKPSSSPEKPEAINLANNLANKQDFVGGERAYDNGVRLEHKAGGVSR